MIEELKFEELNIRPINPLLSRCEIKVCYVSDKPNRNGSVITKEAMDEIANTLPGCPIVGYYNEQKEDFEGHNEIIEFDTHTGEVKFKVLTFPYGFVPTNAKVWYQDYKEDGEIRKYLCTEGILWTGQFPESKKIFENPNGKGQSMEFDEESLISLYNMRNGCMIINEAVFSKLCVLGDDVEPCFEGARVIPKFSLGEDFKEKIYNAIEQFRLMEDEKPKMEDKENKIELELEEIKGKFSTLTTDYESLQKTLDEANIKIADYQKLETQFSELKESFASLEEETKNLREFKAKVELKEKEDMIASFSMLPEEDKAEVRENIDKYTLEEIESKLAVTCFRKKIPYTTVQEEEAVVEETKEPILTYSLNSDRIGSGKNDSPDWIKAVRQKEQELFN